MRKVNNAPKLKGWRLARKLTQEQAAQELHTPVGTYRRWEQGTRRVPGVLSLACAYIDHCREKPA